MSLMELISDEPLDAEPYIDYLIAHYVGHRDYWRNEVKDELVEKACVIIKMDHFLMQLEDIKRKMHRPGAPVTPATET